MWSKHWVVATLSFCKFFISHGECQVQAPALPGRGSAISSQDRIYTGDQTSNTITVIDPSENKVLGTIRLGDTRLGRTLNPQNVESVNAHGLGFSRDGKYLVSLSTLSNTVTVVKTEDNSIVTQTFVDRNPHEAFFAPDNRTVWIGTRGVSSVNIIDGLNGTFLGRIKTGKGPSKVLFSPQGDTAYVNHIGEPIVSVIHVPTRQVQYNITGLAHLFSSDMMISADGASLWVAHKMTGQVSVIDLHNRKVISVLETGADTNHPNFAYVNGVRHAFVTVASLNATRVYRQDRSAHVPVHVTDIRSTGVEPHGMWPSPDNSRIYVVNEHSDTVDVIATSNLSIIDTFPVGQEGQALVYVANAVPTGTKNVTQNLGKQGLGLLSRTKNVPLHETGNSTQPKFDTNGNPIRPRALVTARSTGGLDMFQVIGRQLVLNETYTVSARCKACRADSDKTPLVTFQASTKSRTGCGGAPQVLAFFKFLDVYDMNSLELRQGKK